MAEAGGRIVTLTCIAGLTGLPQIHLPLAETPDGIPVGLSLIGWRGGDCALLRLASAITR
jgi:amidase